MRPYFERDGVTLYLGDCREIVPGLDPVDHVITDPPYDAQTHAGARTTTRSGDAVQLVQFAPISQEDLRLVLSAARARRWTIATLAWRHVCALDVSPPDGLRFVRFGVWTKPNGTPQLTGDRPAQGFEAIAFLHAAGQRMRWNGGGRRAVWNIPKVNGEHPTQKPDALVSEFVQLFSDPGEMILDPFAGSGTTLVVARRFGRRAIGIEMDERWCEVAARRLSQAEMDFGPSCQAERNQETESLFGGCER